MRSPAPLAAVALMALFAAGCGEDAGGGGVEVVATTPLTADLARQVAGRGAEVRALLPRGTDPHGYEPRPSDVREVSRAELVIRSGGEIDDWMGDVLDSSGGDAPVVTLIDSVHRRDGDPHWW